MSTRALSKVLWENIVALMGVEDPSLNAIAQRTGVGRGNIQRIRDGENVTLSTIESLARAFRVPAWQMLVPKSGPILPTLEQAAPVMPLRPLTDEQLVDHLVDWVRRLPPDSRSVLADVVAGWVRMDDNGDRKAAVLALMRLRPKQPEAA